MKKILNRLLWIILMIYTTSSKAQKVTLDYYFNHEVHQAKDGKSVRFHYLWDDVANSGFSKWGDIWKAEGGSLDTLAIEPTFNDLKGTAIYIIVDPDSKKENPSPNYITEKDAAEISYWVKKGGTLVMMANDSANVDLEHFNILAAKFGLHFNNDLLNHVVDDKHFADGEAIIADSTVLNKTNKVFLKDVCSIFCRDGNCRPILFSKSGEKIAIFTKYGKGNVFAVGDPWFYNEYLNGRLPTNFENYKAAKDLSKWLLFLSKNLVTKE